jgi:lysophospholipase
MLETLTEIPENPVPAGAICGTIVTSGGKLRYARFPAADKDVLGTVVMLHGRNESIEKYFETANDLSERGFASATFDWRGQGGSDRIVKDLARGYVDSFHSYVSDLDEFFKQVVLPDCRGPYYVLAHSTGGLIALLAAPKLANRVKRMVLCAPLLELTDQPISNRQIRILSTLFSWIGLGAMYFGGGPKPPEAKPFAKNILTSDPARYERNGKIVSANPLLALGSPTAAWVRAACRAMTEVNTPEFAASLRIPTLFIAAGADRIVSTPAVEYFASHARFSGFVTIDGAHHEILQEADHYREQLWAAFDAFIPGSERPAARQAAE